VNYLGIDVSKKVASLVVSRLRKQKAVAGVLNQGPYREVPDVCRVLVDCTWTEDELDDWLYRLRLPDSDFEYGTFTRQSCLKADGYLFDRIEAVPLQELV